MYSLKSFACRSIPAFILAVFWIVQISPAQARSPELELVPKEVTALLQETTHSAAQMEEQLQDHVEIFEAKMELYDESHCHGSNSPGCREINRQIQEQYTEMLELMQSHLPEIKKGISSTREKLGRRISSRVGHAMTPAQLSEFFETEDLDLPALRESRYNLSDRLEQYYELIQDQRNTTPLVEAASLIYLDSERSAQILDHLEMHLARQEQILAIDEAFGEVTPEMKETMDAVKGVIFGEKTGDDSLPGKPQRQTSRTKRELD